MKLEEQKNRLLIFMSIFIVMVILCGGFYLAYRILFKEKEKEKPRNEKDPVVTDVSSFDIKLIKEINKTETGNYLISPYSIEMAFSMLREGTDGESRKQIENLIGNREINDLKVKERINVANGVFINNSYKEKVLKSYYDTMQDKFNAEIVYDKFENADVVNDWVNKQTYKMIPKLLDNLDGSTVMILVNALAIDVPWKYSFDCEKTNGQEFIKEDGTKYNVAMMHQTYEKGAKYFNTDDAKGVILSYQAYDKDGKEVKDGGSNLEFVGILPKNGVSSYINNLDEETFKEIDEVSKTASETDNLKLSLPRFSYDYKIKDFKNNLKNLGITDVFDAGKADLSKMIDESVFVSDVIHKTHIEVKEKGTKAAAVTGIVVDKSAIDPDEEENVITFNKPFVYMIRDKETKEMLFFGVVYEPNKWDGSTCEK